MDHKYREIADASHRAFHDFYLPNLPDEISEKVHSLVDTLVINLQNAQDEIDNLRGRLEETERIIDRAMPGERNKALSTIGKT